MKFIRLAVLATVSMQSLIGQSVAATKHGGVTFEWDSKQAIELDYRHTIAKSTDLRAANKAALIEAVATQVRPDMADREIGSNRELRQLIRHSRLALRDLNGDGVAEVIVQASDYKLGCGATGNCRFWIFEKTPDGYKTILDTQDRAGPFGIEVLTIKPTRSDGFSDLVLASHASASEKTLLVYRYKNGRYRQSACYDANWLIPRDDTYKELKHPQITRCTP